MTDIKPSISAMSTGRKIWNVLSTLVMVGLAAIAFAGLVGIFTKAAYRAFTWGWSIV